MKDWYDQAQEQDITAVAQQLGMKNVGTRYGPCPACGSFRSEKDRRPPIRFSKTNSKPERDRWFCNCCSTMGNVFDLVSHALHNCAASDLPRFSLLREFFSTETLFEIKQKPVVRTEPSYPPVDEVKAIVDAATPLYMIENKRVLTWAEKRGLDIRKLKNGPRLLSRSFDYDGLTQVPVRSSSACWFPKAWAEKYPIIIPLVDYRGNLRSIYGRSITTAVRPKCRAPIHYTTKNLFFVNKLAWEFLRGQTRPAAIWIVEGEMDYMSILQHDDIPVIGIRSGAIEHLMMMPWHITQTVVIGTDNDHAGNKYARQIAERVFPAQPKRLQLQILKKKGGE